MVNKRHLTPRVEPEDNNSYCRSQILATMCYNLQPEYRTHLTLRPFVYNPPPTICMNLLLRYIYLQLMPPLSLCDSDKREEG